MYRTILKDKTLSLVVLLLSLPALFSCNPQQPESSTIDNKDSTTSLLSSIEHAHHKQTFLSHDAIAFDITLAFNGKPRLSGIITMLTNSTKIRIDRTDGSSLIYDGEQGYFTPDSAFYPKARFDLFTWSYFFAAPYKLSDPGTVWEVRDSAKLHGTNYATAMLTFDEGIGDSPDDWYLIYADTNTHLLSAMAYIVTMNTSVDEANEDPHAITYDGYELVDGVPIATHWRFWRWRAETGLEKELGKGTVSNIRFIDNPDPSFFRKPPNAKAF